MKRECKTERLVKGLFVLVRDDGGLDQGDSGADDKLSSGYILQVEFAEPG